MITGLLDGQNLLKLKPGKHHDGRGLYLIVKESGARSWVLRLNIPRSSRRPEIGIGGLAEVSIDVARFKAHELRIKHGKGVDVAGEKKATKEVEIRQANMPTFEALAREYHATLSPTFDEVHSYNWLASLETYIFPSFGKKSVDAIESSDIVRAFEKFWLTVADTAGRTLRRVSKIFEYAQAKGYRTVSVNGLRVTMPNPCDGIRTLLPKQRRVESHHEALPYADVPKFIEKLRTSQSALAVKLGLEFLVLTCARTSEVLNARWEEIDLDARVWTVPKERMKMEREHKVPLSARCVEILKLAKQFNDGDIVFPGRYPGEPLSNMSFLMALRRMGYADITAHGFRSCFKSWSHEETRTDHLVIEASMAHVVRGIERHYLRTTFFDQRRKLMDQWSRFSTSAIKG
jgi:integrase